MSEAQPSSQPDKPVFPDVPAVDGEFYGILMRDGQRIVSMTEQTWNNFGTTLESLRRVAAAQDQRIKELLAQVVSEQATRADMLDRLNALRDVRRAEKRADILGDSLVLPGSKDFVSSTKR